MQDGRGVELQKGQEPAARVHHVQQVQRRRAYDYEEHEVVYSEARVPVAEHIHPLHKAAHLFTSRERKIDE